MLFWRILPWVKRKTLQKKTISEKEKLTDFDLKTEKNELEKEKVKLEKQEKQEELVIEKAKNLPYSIQVISTKITPEVIEKWNQKFSNLFENEKIRR